MPVRFEPNLDPASRSRDMPRVASPQKENAALEKPARRPLSGEAESYPRAGTLSLVRM
jgi:hypothetical protein